MQMFSTTGKQELLRVRNFDNAFLPSCIQKLLIEMFGKSIFPKKISLTGYINSAS